MRGFERVRSRSAILAKCARFAAKNARRAILPLGFFWTEPTRLRRNSYAVSCLKIKTQYHPLSQTHLRSHLHAEIATTHHSYPNNNTKYILYQMTQNLTQSH